MADRETRDAETATPARVLTVKEVQHELKLSKNGVYEAIGRGEIPSIRIGRKILVPRSALDRLLSGEAA